MAYDMYNVQMSNMWVQRVNREVGSAEKFWLTQALSYLGGPEAPKGSSLGRTYQGPDADRRSVASSTRSSVSKATKAALQTRMDELAASLEEERSMRKALQAQVEDLKATKGTGPLAGK